MASPTLFCRLLTAAKISACILMAGLAISPAALAQTAAPKPKTSNDFLPQLGENINIEGLETNFDPETGIATATGQVHIKFGDVEITAGKAIYNSNTKDVIAQDNVTILKSGTVFRGENIIYNFDTQDLKSNNLRSGLPPLYYNSALVKSNLHAMEQDSGEIQRIDAKDTYFTTHDSSDPNYHMTAHEMTIYPDDRVVMHNVKIYVGDTPVFWLPAYVQPLDREQGYYFQPGYASEWGVFLLQQYGVMYGDHTLAQYHFDLRSKRGVAGGVDLKSLRFRDNNNFGHILLYYAYDTSPETGIGDTNRGTGAPSKDRYRIEFQHRIYIPGPAASTWYLDFDLNKLSDEFMLEDYYFEEFRNNPQPDNNIQLVKHDDRFVATLWTRFQMNDFYRTDERLPELALEFTRQPLWHSGVFYQGETSAGYYRDQLATADISSLNASIASDKALLSQQLGVGSNETLLGAASNVVSANNLAVPVSPLTPRDQVQNDLANLEAQINGTHFFRVHSYHEFLYPMAFGQGNWFTVTPRIGGGLQYYDDISGSSTVSGSQSRGIFHAGLDVSGRFSKTWNNVQSETWGIDGLRHVVQPYVNYSYLNADPITGLPAIDRLTDTTRPRPIDVPLFTAIDDLSSWNIARVGVRNVLQTKRDDATVTWMSLNSYFDVFFEDPDPIFHRDISNFYNDFFWQPLPWLRLNIDSQFPLGNAVGNFTEVNTGLTWMPFKFFNWTVSHAYLSGDPEFADSSLITSRIFLRLNENWGFTMNHIYEATDHQLEFQSYSLSHDLSSWVVSVGGLVRSINDTHDFGVVLTFSLKDFPQVTFPLDLDPNPAGRGGG